MLDVDEIENMQLCPVILYNHRSLAIHQLVQWEQALTMRLQPQGWRVTVWNRSSMEEKNVWKLLWSNTGTQCQASSEMLAGHLLEEQPQRPSQRFWHYRPIDLSANTSSSVQLAYTKVGCVSVWRKSDLAMPNLGPLQQLWSKLIHIFWQLCKKDTVVRVNQRGGQPFLANWIQVGVKNLKIIPWNLQGAETIVFYSLYTSFWALAPSDILLPKSKLCPPKVAGRNSNNPFATAYTYIPRKKGLIHHISVNIQHAKHLPDLAVQGLKEVLPAKNCSVAKTYLATPTREKSNSHSSDGNYM